jgi:hypothetical protein
MGKLESTGEKGPNTDLCEIPLNLLIYVNFTMHNILSLRVILSNGKEDHIADIHIRQLSHDEPVTSAMRAGMSTILISPITLLHRTNIFYKLHGKLIDELLYGRRLSSRKWIFVFHIKR